MIRQNLHTHTVFCDGKNTVDEMARAAIDAGLTSLGFSGHSRALGWGMDADATRAYRAAVAAARMKYAGQLTVYCGLEWDSLTPPEDAAGFQYVIGSVHYIDLPQDTPCVDMAPEETRRALAAHFQNDPAAMAEAYFAQYAALASRTFVDIVGHYDLITIYDETAHIFDDADPRYIDAAMAGLELLCRAGKIFEVNTGAMSRGWRTSPYPSRRLLSELRARNARVLVTSDAHSAESIAYAFDEAETLLKEVGFREIWELTKTGFIPIGLG